MARQLCVACCVEDNPGVIVLPLLHNFWIWIHSPLMGAYMSRSRSFRLRFFCLSGRGQGSCSAAISRTWQGGAAEEWGG